GGGGGSFPPRGARPPGAPPRGGADESDSDSAETTQPAAGADNGEAAEPGESGDSGHDDGDDGEGGTRRRRRRRRRGAGEGDGDEPVVDDPPNTVTRVREPRKSTRSRSDRGDKAKDKDKDKDKDDDDGVRSVKGSTRLEAKKQRRREGRDAGRRRPSVITEAEFLARRESVDRVMAVRQTAARTQIAVLEDDVLVEHYVSTASSSGLLGNVYLGKVQNVLPSMEAAFVDIGKGRNAVLYAGEVNWDAAGLDGQPRRIELALKSGDPVLVQVTKDPIGHKGARLTSQISLAGRYLVLVPGGAMTGISRKLPENERSRLKAVLKRVVPEGAGVIVRTAAEGASEEELARDVARLTAQWEDIERKSTKGSAAPTLLYGEPDMTIRVVRDIFNEDFASLVISGDDAWDMVEPYVSHVAPDLRDRLSRWTSEEDIFTARRVDEQLTKALDRKVWLPSGGYLVIDRTEAMIVVDVNTGKFIGQGGNLEETVTKNNIEAAEEIVRQLRLRDLGGIIVIDFIDMVLESNRDLVLRRLLECLGRDRTKHQVAEVTSLGLVQMTRKRVGQGLHEAFSEPCEACNGRGYHISTEPVESRTPTSDRRGDGGGGGGRGAKRSQEPRTAKQPKVSPVAAEDPVEPAPVAAAAEDPVEPAPVAAAAEPAPKRRRRKASSPVTTL
ncbi:MAG: Rne/Rng family ribonuclease, partial [Spirochaetaceae bacterium]|nr:Rne/Rng family ribonuclease [Spirochaetaceae bacterium]